MLAPSDAFRKKTIKVAAVDARPIGCFEEPNVTKLAAVDARPIGCFWEPNVTKLVAVDARPIGCFWEPNVTRVVTKSPVDPQSPEISSWTHNRLRA